MKGAKGSQVMRKILTQTFRTLTQFLVTSWELERDLHLRCQIMMTKVIVQLRYENRGLVGDKGR